MNKILLLITKSDKIKKILLNSKSSLDEESIVTISDLSELKDKFTDLKYMNSEIGFIIFEVDQRKSIERQPTLKQFQEELSKIQDNKIPVYPPLIFLLSCYSIQFLESRAIESGYDNFRGIYTSEEFENDAELFTLIKNSVEPEIPGADDIPIGKTCVLNFEDSQRRSKIREFYEKYKFSSLFIGKNKKHLLRLRNELIKMKAELRAIYGSEAVKYVLGGKGENPENNSGRSNPKKLNSKAPISSEKFFSDLKKSESDYSNEFTNIIFSKENSKWKGFSVIVVGETGTGKTLVAQWISSFIKGMFQDDGDIIDYNDEIFNVLSLNCSTIEENLFETILYGQKSGHGTNTSENIGYIMMSTGKVLFLDEIGELKLSSQPKLLTYLDSHKFTPCGYSGKPLFVPNIVVAATNRDVKKSQNFRQDLFHRFKVKINLMPLRERRNELEVLIDYVLQNPIINPFIDINHESRDDRRAVTHIQKGVMKFLKNFNYEGNFRELESLLGDLVEIARNDSSAIISQKHLNKYLELVKPVLSQDESSGEIDRLAEDGDNMKRSKRNAGREKAVYKAKVKIKDIDKVNINAGNQSIQANDKAELIVELLKKEKKLSSKEIAKILNLSTNYLRDVVLNKLIKNNTVEIFYENNNRKKAFYVLKS